MNPNRPRMHRAHPAPGNCPGTGRHPWPMLAIALLAVGLFATSEPARADDQAPEPVTAATADSPLELPVSGLIERVKYRALVRPDPDGELDPQDLLASDAGFAPFDPGLETSAPPLWLKLHVRADTDSSGHYVLRVARRFFRQFEFYAPRLEDAPEAIGAAFNQPTDSTIVGRQFAFEFAATPGETVPLLIRVETLQEATRPVELWIQDQSSFAIVRAQTFLGFGLYFGVLLALIFHNLILYFNLRHRGHLLYVLAMTSMVLTMSADSGLLQNYVLPDWAQPLAVRLNVLFVSLFVISTSLFYQAFTDSRRFVPRIDRWVHWMVWVIAIFVAILLFTPPLAFTKLLLVIQPIWLVLSILLLVGSYTAGRRGSDEAWIFFAAWSVFAFSGLVRTFVSLNLVERNAWIEYSMYLGSVLEASILALGLSYRVRQLYERHSKALQEQHKAARLANLDPLTNAYNRRFLENYLGNLLRSRSKREFAGALMILDLDDFKAANDLHGHAAGDAILRDLVQRCQQVMRESDVLCRLGGDEFVIVLSESTGTSVREVAERIAGIIGDEPFIFENRQIPVTTSIGVVADIPEGSTVIHCLRMADQALYRAKQAGRNRVVVHDPEDTTPFRHGPSVPREGQESA